MKTAFAFAALVGYAAAECPNACSGHGTCGAKDSCSCYQNYQGNDCSERTCYFGLAHVDSPKGDLNADGLVSGPLTTVITGSEVYPWGTTEQFPNANSNEGHFYMECSNKGICDRKTGTCDCFDGYTGTACARAACPNDCSGHGTCESIKELAEMRSFDTTAHDVPTTRAANSNTGQDYNAAIEESYSYDLWDADKTMGCKCDPVYYGADCSLKKCKYGVDPLFYDSTDGAIHQTTVVHLGSTGGCTGATCATQASTAASAANTGGNIRYPTNIAGDFKIIFYDVFGEKYVTKALSAINSGTGALTPADVERALEALPNGVISTDNTDVTGTPPPAVSVAMQNKAGTVSTVGGFGGGAIGVAATPTPTPSTIGTAVGAGLGTMGAGTASAFGASTVPAAVADGTGTGPEFTITFTTNPGILKSIEIDTSNIQNSGVADYWVANARQGQFSSRYSKNLGRVNTLVYGSQTLYTNTDLQADVVGHATTASSLIKVGGQEFRVTGEAATHLTLSEPYLGASITATLTDTGTRLGGARVYAQSAGVACTANCVTGFVASTRVLTLTGDFSAASFVGTWFRVSNAAGANNVDCVGQIESATATTITFKPGTSDCADFTITDGVGDVGTIAGTATNSVGGFYAAPVSGKAAEIHVAGVDTAIKANALVSGTGLSVGDCNFIAAKTGNPANTEVAVKASGGTSLLGGATFDCYPQNKFGPFSVVDSPIYRRTDNPNNQNIYKAPSDTGAAMTNNLMLTRGSAAAYIVEDAKSGGGGLAHAVVETVGTGATIGQLSDQGFTITAGPTAAAGEPVFVNGRGPMKAKVLGATDAILKIDDVATGFNKFFPRAVAAGADAVSISWPVFKGLAADGETGVVSGGVLLLDGRRYRIKTRGTGAGMTGRSYVELSENYAGGSLEKLCDDCGVEGIATSTGPTVMQSVNTYAAAGSEVAGVLLNQVNLFDRIVAEGFIHEDFLTTVVGETAVAAVDGTTDPSRLLQLSVGGAYGSAAGASAWTGGNLASKTAAAGNGLALYRTRYGAKGAVTPTIVTEVDTATNPANTYQYVAQCSNRGTCDASTGVCKCFKGYANDNCNKQNMLAM